jgi:hypothetical protein
MVSFVARWGHRALLGGLAVITLTLIVEVM